MKRLLLIAAVLLIALWPRLGGGENWAERKAPFYSSTHITSSGTTSITSTTSYISSIVVTATNAGTTWTLLIQNKEGTPKVIWANSGTGLTVGTSFMDMDVPVISTGGIAVVTAGTAGVVDVFITYWTL
jgi:hypothetical protein